MVRHNQPTNYLIHEKVSLQKRFWAKMLLAFLSVLDSLTSVLDGISICSSCRIKNNLLLFFRELFHPRMFSIFFNILLCFHFLNNHFLFLLTWHFFPFSDLFIVSVENDWHGKSKPLICKNMKRNSDQILKKSKLHILFEETLYKIVMQWFMAELYHVFFDKRSLMRAWRITKERSSMHVCLLCCKE